MKDNGFVKESSEIGVISLKKMLYNVISAKRLLLSSDIDNKSLLYCYLNSLEHDIMAIGDENLWILEKDL